MKSVKSVRSGYDDEDLVRLYLRDIAQYPLLTKEDEVRLAQAMEARTKAAGELSSRDAELSSSERRRLRREVARGDDAERTFVQSNLRLVVHIAKKYQSSGLPLLDLIQEGNLGLIHAVGKFDWQKGFKFSTYASWWVRQAVSRGIANSARTIRLPVHAADLNIALRAAQSQLHAKLGRRATSAELSVELDVTVERIEQILLIRAQPLSLSEPIGTDSDTELGDIVEDGLAVSPFEAAAISLLPRQVSRYLAQLDEREREILRLRFGIDRGEPRTLEEIGKCFNLTRERIRQIEARAMSKLRHPSNEAEIRDLLFSPSGGSNRGF
jgi:RNA polymerase sigma factor (sigma-70 family)